jgi:flagellar biogenesis protein FliO
MSVRTRRAAQILALAFALALQVALAIHLAPAASAQTGPQAVATPAAATADSPQDVTEGDEPLPFMAAGARHESESEAPSAVGLLARTIGALLVVLGLAVGGGWLLRRLSGARFGAAEAGPAGLRLISTLSLGERRTLSVVSFGGRTLLIGSTAQTISLLAEADDEEGVEAAALARPVADLLRDSDSFEGRLAAADLRREVA